MTAAVALVHCPDYSPERVQQAIDRQFELLGGIGLFVKRGDQVLLKPNFIAPRSHRQSPAQTHPQVILAVARRVQDYGGRPFVADSPAWADVMTCAAALELIEPLKKMGVPIRALNGSRICRVGAGRTKVGISPTALEADVIINLPKFKAHQQLVATFAVKNMFGCIAGKRKAMWHFRRGADVTAFCTLLIDVYRHLNPALTIIDGITAMEGPGPIRGPAKSLGWLIAGVDPIACETVCCRLVDLKPAQVPVIATARRMGWGDSDTADLPVRGDPLPDPPCRDFTIPTLIPIRFTLARVCRSIARQILLLARKSNNSLDKP
jgi:uncharacterized protein (DUF362 family)